VSNILVLGVALLIGVAAILLTLGVARVLKQSTGDEEFADKLLELRKSEYSKDDNENEKLDRWSRYWYELTRKTGVIPDHPESPGRLVIVVSLIALGVGTLVWPGDILGGLAAAAIVIVGYKLYLGGEVNKRSKKMERQLPLLLSQMRARLQANDTPQQAIVNAADELPSPLGDELRILRSEINVNVSLEKALRNLVKRIPSKEMQFLVSSIEIAVASGADLDPQLEIIQDIITQRARIRSKLATAVAEVQPSIYISAIVIPAALAWSFYSDETNREFWTSLFGFLAMGGIAVLYIIGLVVSRVLVRNVEKT
jgi:tight adherence protein B